MFMILVSVINLCYSSYHGFFMNQMQLFRSFFCAPKSLFVDNFSYLQNREKSCK